MRVPQPIQISIEDKDKDRELIESLIDANNKNSNNFFRLSRDITFDENIKVSIIEYNITTEENRTIIHNLGFNPKIYTTVGDSRVERLEKLSLNSKNIILKVYLKSSPLTAAISASANAYVTNPYIFKVGDLVKIGANIRTLTEVDYDNRKLVVDSNIATAAQFDIVKLYKDNVKFFVG